MGEREDRASAALCSASMLAGENVSCTVGRGSWGIVDALALSYSSSVPYLTRNSFTINEQLSRFSSGSHVLSVNGYPTHLIRNSCFPYLREV